MFALAGLQTLAVAGSQILEFDGLQTFAAPPVEEVHVLAAVLLPLFMQAFAASPEQELIAPPVLPVHSFVTFPRQLFAPGGEHKLAAFPSFPPVQVLVVPVAMHSLRSLVPIVLGLADEQEAIAACAVLEA